MRVANRQFADPQISVKSGAASPAIAPIFVDAATLFDFQMN